jgi:hypothetical protein
MSRLTDRRRKAIIVSAMGGACYVCGEDRLAVLTLHHRYEGLRPVSNQAPRRFPSPWGHAIDASTWAEVWLCDLLCHNCHNDLHSSIEGTCWEYLTAHG